MNSRVSKYFRLLLLISSVILFVAGVLLAKRDNFHVHGKRLALNHVSEAAKPSLKSRTPDGKKYVIYLCDKKLYCFGLGDRQRGIVSVYMLSMAINRTFGLIMTEPAQFTDLYEPNEVSWSIPQSELIDRTSRELQFFRKDTWPEGNSNFNEKYPEDVVYIRTNLFRQSKVVPRTAKWTVFPQMWTKLMRPTQNLRDNLNHQLKTIVQAMETEVATFKSFNSSQCQSCKMTNDSSQSSQFKTCNGNTLTNFTTSTPDYCVMSPPKVQISLTTKDVDALKGHATVDLKLVCVHLRMGKNPTFPWEKRARNYAKSLPEVWKFLRPFVDKGHHVFVATDSMEAREAAKAQFGYRLHTSPQPIMHIDNVQKGHDKKEGFKLVAMEQLLMSTSCHVLVISHSNLSIKAAMIRGYIQTRARLYIFQNGKVLPYSVKRLF